MGYINSIRLEAKSLFHKLSLFVPAIGLLALSLAVINWGLQYKMSLYQDSSPSAQSPAKLWTGKTVASSAIAVERIQRRPVTFILLLTELLVLLRCAALQPASWARWGFAVPWKLKLRHILRAFCFHPPPVVTMTLHFFPPFALL